MRVYLKQVIKRAEKKNRIFKMAHVQKKSPRQNKTKGRDKN